MQTYVKKHISNDSDGVTSYYPFPVYFLVTKKNLLENAGNNNNTNNKYLNSINYLR